MLKHRKIRHFHSVPPKHVRQPERRVSVDSNVHDTQPSARPVYIGISAADAGENHIVIGFALHDGNYTIDYSIEDVNLDGDQTTHSKKITGHIIQSLEKFSHDHCFKYIGAGVTRKLSQIAPHLCTELWRDLDAVPMVFDVSTTTAEAAEKAGNLNGSVPSFTRSPDELADSAVRKLILLFGAQHAIRLSIGYRNEVDVDIGGRVHLIDSVDEFRHSVREPTWNAVLKYGADLRDRGIKIGFFSSTPQGGGVALMRHAMIRFYKSIGVQAKWFIPKPSPSVFRITKNNHNILQGVADPDTRLSEHSGQQMTEWIEYNAHRFWLSPGGPLAEGGIDVAFIDDPQMPGLIPLIKKARPRLPIVYRSHIEIRSDLVKQEGSPQAGVWDYLWERIQGADVFISHPVSNFVPANVPLEKVGLLPASTDWLDGLNKPMREWDLQYYMQVFRSQCFEAHMAQLEYPNREYMVQIARFDPSKGLNTAIKSYIEFRKKLEHDSNAGQQAPPQLLLAGHGAVDDPDASIVYDELTEMLSHKPYRDYAGDIVLMRVGPSDQILNALMSNAKFALQLSSREGFEVKVSEALHKGKPIIATHAGGIPLQVVDGKTGFVCTVDDSDSISSRMLELWLNKDGVHTRMSEAAKVSVSDEVGTVGNAVSWMYLASELTKKDGKVLPNARWINDMMREGAGQPYAPDEPRLPRDGTNVKPQ